MHVFERKKYYNNVVMAMTHEKDGKKADLSRFSKQSRLVKINALDNLPSYIHGYIWKLNLKMRSRVVLDPQTATNSQCSLGDKCEPSKFPWNEQRLPNSIDCVASVCREDRQITTMHRSLSNTNIMESHWYWRHICIGKYYKLVIEWKWSRLLSI